MAKEIIFDKEARDALLKGAKILSDAVKVTLGPKGRNMMIDSENGSPTVTKDGVTVAKSIDLEDKFENMGAQLVKDVASKTADLAGDGTTTATVLAYAITRDGMKMVMAGANPIDIKRGIDKAVDVIIDTIENNSKEIESSEDIENIATISANNDPEVGKLIAKAMDTVGNDGVITIEESKTPKTTMTVVDGMEYKSGLASVLFSTDEVKKICEIKDPLVLVVDRKINTQQEITPILEQALVSETPLQIIAEDYSDQVLSLILAQKVIRNMVVSASLAPSFGENKSQSLDDIAVLLGTKVVRTDAREDVKLAEMKLEDLGTAGKITTSNDVTTIINGGGSEDLITERANFIREQIENSKNDYEKEQLQERLARLVSGVAVINVGAQTIIEMKEKKDRVDDALHATKSAIQEGIVEGGGVALLRCLDAIDKIEFENIDEKVGADIMRNAIQEPIKQISTNAGVSGDVVISTILHSNELIGYNAKTDVYENMITSCVLDPAKVTKSAVKNASSVASMILLSGGVIATIPEEYAKATMQMPVGMNGMM